MSVKIARVTHSLSLRLQYLYSKTPRSQKMTSRKSTLSPSLT